MWRQRSITPYQNNSKFSSTQHARFHQLTRTDSTLNRFESRYIIQLGISCKKTCLWRKAWAVCEPQRSECYHRHMAWGRHQTARIRKAILQWKKRLAVVAKENGGPIQHIFCWSFDWWFSLLWRFGIVCVEAAMQMMSSLQKLLYGMWRYSVCITTNTKKF